MSLRDQAKNSIPRVLRTSFSQSNALDLEKEQFEREQLNAVTKALSILETPVKEKHVRTIIIGTFKQKSSIFLWNLVSSRAPLHGNPIICWKFCCILHKVLREGHPRTVIEANRHIGLLEDLGKLWGHLKEGYGRLINLYCKLLVRKLKFHDRYSSFPGNLSVDKEDLLKTGNNDAGNFYEMCIEFLDYLEDILNLEKGIFDSLDMSKSNSMTSSGQCRLSPLIVCIQDSAHLYDYCVKIIFLLHQHLPPDTLSGHTSRFLSLFNRLRKFYYNCSNLQYFKNLVQVPSLPDNPPNFLVAAELRQHVTPVAVIPEPSEESDMDAADSIQAPDDRDRYIDQLLAEVETLQLRVTQLEDEKGRVEQMYHEAQDRLNYEKSTGDRLRAEVGAAQTEVSALTAMVKEQQHMHEQDKNRGLEEKFNKLKEVYQKLREEHINLLRKKAETDKQLASSNISRDEANTARDSLEKKLKEVLDKMNQAKAELSDSKQEQDIQVHNMQASLASLQSKLAAGEDEIKRREEKERTVEQRLLESEGEIAQLKVKLSDALQNKHNLEEEVLDLTGKLREAEMSTSEQLVKVEEMKSIATLKENQIKQSGELTELYRAREADCFITSLDTALDMLENVRRVEDIDSISCSVQTLSCICKRICDTLNLQWPDQTDLKISVVSRLSHGLCLAWGLTRGVANNCPDLDLSSSLMDLSDLLRTEGTQFFGDLRHDPAENEIQRKMTVLRGILDKMDEEARKIGVKIGQEVDIADLVSMEISAMDAAIEEAATKMEELLAASRANDVGQKLEVNGKIIDSCTSLVKAIKELVKKSKILQKEIVAERGGQGSEKDFYRKNSRWTEGLISAAKAVGLGAKLLVDAADRVVLGNGRFEEIMAASQEISASTAQLVISSRVKAREGSDSFNHLKDASKVVTQATGTVVATAKSCATQSEEVELDFSSLSAHQTKTLEMEAQVHLLKLESEVEMARTRLGALRKSLYKESTA